MKKTITNKSFELTEEKLIEINATDKKWEALYNSPESWQAEISSFNMNRREAGLSLSRAIFVANRLHKNANGKYMTYSEYLKFSGLLGDDLGQKYYGDHDRTLKILGAITNTELKSKMACLPVSTTRELFKLQKLDNLETLLAEFIDSGNLSSRDAKSFAKSKCNFSPNSKQKVNEKKLSISLELSDKKRVLNNGTEHFRLKEGIEERALEELINLAELLQYSVDGGIYNSFESLVGKMKEIKQSKGFSRYLKIENQEGDNSK